VDGCCASTENKKLLLEEEEEEEEEGKIMVKYIEIANIIETTFKLIIISIANCKKAILVYVCFYEMKIKRNQSFNLSQL